MPATDVGSPKAQLGRSRSRSEAVNDMSGALDYLDEAGVRQLLYDLTEAILENRPVDPSNFIVQSLTAGDFKLRGKGLRPAPVDGRQLDGQGGGQGGIMRIATHVMGSFLEKEVPQDGSDRHVVETLISLAAKGLGAVVEFYSVPDGRGRQCEANKQGKAFILVASSESKASSGQVAEDKLAAMMEQTMSHDMHGSSDIAGAVVRTSLGAHGILLARSFGPDSPTKDSGGALAALPALRTWALGLGERLDMLHYRRQANSASQAIRGTRQVLQHVYDAGMGKHEDQDILGSILPDMLLRQGIGTEAVSFWMKGQNKDELLLVQGSSGPDGKKMNMEACKAVVEACAQEEQVVASQDLAKDRRWPQLSGSDSLCKTMMCVPVGEASGGAGSMTAVLQCGNSATGGRAIDHFDFVSAESLRRCALLSEMIEVREKILNLVLVDQQHQGLRKMVHDLPFCTTAAEMIVKIEEDLPMCFNCEHVTLYFVDTDRNEIWAPPTDALPDGIRVAIGEGLVGNVAADALKNPGADTNVVITNKPGVEKKWMGDMSGQLQTQVRNLMTAPVLAGRGERRLVSVVQVLNKRSCLGMDRSVEFTQRDKELLEVITLELGQGIQNISLDLMWTKTRMDKGDDIDFVKDFTLIGEYYEKERRGRQRVTKVMSVEAIEGIDHELAKRSRKNASSEISEERGIPPEAQKIIDLAGAPVEGADLCDWRIDYWALTELQDFQLAYQALHLWKIFETIEMQDQALYKYLNKVRKSYRENPYHNWQHALSTFHYSTKLVQASNLQGMLTKADLLSLTIASIGHDIDHRGRNNPFEIMSESELSLRYNDLSPLENHHAARLFQIALNGENGGDTNIFGGMEAEVYMTVRKRIIASILATDMKHHGHHVKLLQDYELPSPGDANEDQKQFLIELIIHWSDIGNPVMPPDISARWGTAIAEEFSQQVDAEAALGIPVTAFMMGLREPVAAAKSQVGFIDFVVMPLAQNVFRVFPGLAEPKKFLEENKETAMKVINDAKPHAEK